MVERWEYNGCVNTEEEDLYTNLAWDILGVL
jgi:hypothetical protein